MPATDQISRKVEQFHAEHAGEKPYYEFWRGEAFQKSTPTRLHSLIQKILVRMLDDLGYESGAEIELRLDPVYCFVPDVIAVEGGMEDPYPTTPFDLVIEILSPADPFSRVIRKCRLYEQWGIRRILVVDPAARLVWSFENGVPNETDTIARRGDHAVSVDQLWAEVDRHPSR